MFLLNPEYFIYFLLISIIIFSFLYLWRKIASLECYNTLLEKRLNILKKENNELRENVIDNMSDKDLNEAEIIMNTIFNEKIIINDNDCYDDKCELPVAKHNIIEIEVKEVIEEKQDIEEDMNKYIKEDIMSEIESITTDDITNKKKLNKLNLDKLKEMCNSLNISGEGTRMQIIDRILKN